MDHLEDTRKGDPNRLFLPKSIWRDQGADRLGPFSLGWPRGWETMKRRQFGTALVLALALLAVAGMPTQAGGLDAPGGPVVLAVAGKITAANRGAFDPLQDVILGYHEKTFDRAAAFDRAMLEGLGLHEIELAYEKWPTAYRFTGPRLVDVLAAAGAQGRPITALALDDYAKEISAHAIAAHDWIVALARDGQPLGLGQYGPLWILYGGPGGTATAEDEANWPWAVFFIEVN